MSRRERAKMMKWIHLILAMDFSLLATLPDMDLEYIYENLLISQRPE